MRPLLQREHHRPRDRIGDTEPVAAMEWMSRIEALMHYLRGI
jgi:hypothetical protein